ncbi:MAG: PfkB family carbohydrate kinase [Firmicutes bacterium]|nr:PfkB family carbohydrate kinase [Bacillota bacterium]
MKQYDLMILGPATRDVNIDYTGAEDRSSGGAVTFCTPAAVAAGARVLAAVKIAAEDRDILESFRMDPEDVVLLPSEKTTIMRNEYFTPDRERRNSCCAAQSDPITPAELPDVDCRLYHLAGLLYGDFPNELIEHLHTKGMVSADAQGFLRHNEGGKMVFHDWADKRKYLPYMDFLKTDAAEAEILTGLTDRAEAARVLHDWGAKEILISHNTEMLAFDGKTLCTCPVKARNLSGRTGRGDTTFGAYLAMRVTGAGMEEALRYATACVSLKMETPGVFRGTRADVEAYLEQFYQ